MNDSLHYLIMANQMLVQRQLLDQLKDTGITIGQPKVLDYLTYHDGSSQKKLAKGCFLEAGSLTSILNRMEEKGMIERRMLNGNRRTLHVFLTEQGKRSRDLLETAFEQIEAQALDGILPEEYDAFMKTYRKIYENLMKPERGEKREEGKEN